MPSMGRASKSLWLWAAAGGGATTVLVEGVCVDTTPRAVGVGAWLVGEGVGFALGLGVGASSR